MRWVLLALLTILVATPLDAQEEAPDWDVTAARGNVRNVAFVTDEGSWLSVDVSPDGQWVVFDLLGQIYQVSSSGGDAEALTQEAGVALNYHPRYSPDGRSIAFVSDRAGQNNLWIMDADGSNPRSVLDDLNVRNSAPAWTPDGQYVVVRRDWVGTNDGDAAGGDAAAELDGSAAVRLGEVAAGAEQGPEGRTGLWMYHREGGSGVALVGTEVNDARWPSVSADGRYLYFQARTSAREALTGHYQIRRFEFATGKIVTLTPGTADGAAAGRVSSGGAFAPEISPDGRWLAFARQIPDGTISFKGHRFGPRTALWLRDLETGGERLLMDPIAVAVESGSKTLDILPRYGWSADGGSLVIFQGGKIRRVTVADGSVATIPFQARVQRTISEMAYRSFRIDDEPFESRFLRWTTGSPDGRTIAFQSIGRIWTVPASGGTPRRLTPDDFPPLEYGPAWSPDGRWLAFTTWDDLEGGHVWKAPAGGGRPVQLTQDAGEYVHPAWSADGSTLVLARGAGATRQGRTFTHNAWWDIVTLSADGGAVTAVAQAALPADAPPSSVARRSIVAPSFGPDGRIFFPELSREGGSTTTDLVSVDREGGDRRVHLTLPYADEVVPSPDGRWAAFQEGDNVFVTALPYQKTGEVSVTLQKRRGKLPVRTLSLEGGLFPRWKPDGRTVEFGSGRRYFTYDVETEAADTVTISLNVPRRLGDGRVAFTGARVVTLRDDEVLEGATVVVDGARIACVGDCPTDGADRVIDAAGATIIPGLVDMHSHHYREHRGYRPRRDYELAIYLAYGVTTSLDNSMWSQNIFPTAEMVEAGVMVGPRTFSTGDPLYRGDAPRRNALSSLEVVRHNVNRLADWGAVSLKQYMQPRRDQRQWVSQAARERGLMVTAEAGDHFYDLSMIMDGQTGFEHPISVIPLYADLARFIGRTGTYYSPTFVVAGPGPWNIEYFFAESDVWKDPKQRRWMPWRMLAGHLRRRELRPETDYSFPILAQGLADVVAEGGYGAIGSHGEHHGLAPHYEVWMAASAMGPLGALRVASLHGARMLGAERDLGSIEVGKLADLLVLNANPLDDIRQTTNLRYVMKGGVLYDADTLDEVWPTAQPFGPYYWVDEDALRSDNRPVN